MRMKHGTMLSGCEKVGKTGAKGVTPQELGLAHSCRIAIVHHPALDPFRSRADRPYGGRARMKLTVQLQAECT